MPTDTIKSIQEQRQQALESIRPEHLKNELTHSMTDFTQYFERFFFWAIDILPDVIKAIIGLVIGLFIIRTILKITKKRFQQRNVDPSLRGFLLSIIKFVLYALLVLVVASNLGFKTTAILGAFSGLILAAGLAIQGSLSNFAGGVLVLIFRPFEVGDYIENNAGTQGTVEKIDLLYTTLTTVDGLKIFSPNGTLANSVIKNYTKITQRRMEFVVGISYDDNIKNAKEVILEVLNNDARIKENPAPKVFVSELADSSVNLTIQAWTTKEDFILTKHDIQEHTKNALDKAGISIPFPQQEMRIISDNNTMN